MNWQDWVNSVLQTGADVAKAALGKSETAPAATPPAATSPGTAAAPPQQSWFERNAYYILGAFALTVLVLAVVFRRE
ncbi:MAG: hypothetical protein N2378_05905 [Chloroflexaceae bacterium]|nr:hypothetical protein [Chloroflexaceae bacterium]